jgi:Mrp family chromosome partitioning ATPase
MPAVNAAMDAEVIAVSADATILVSKIGETSKSGLINAANALTKVKANLIGTIINKMDMEQYISVHEDYDYFQNERYIKKNKKRKKAKRVD